MPDLLSSGAAFVRGEKREGIIMGIQLVQLDTRKRVSLAKIATANSYIVTTEPSGRMIFEPAVVMTELEAQLLGDSKLRKKIAARVEANVPTSPRRSRRPRIGSAA